MSALNYSCLASESLQKAENSSVNRSYLRPTNPKKPRREFYLAVPQLQGHPQPQVQEQPQEPQEPQNRRRNKRTRMACEERNASETLRGLEDEGTVAAPKANGKAGQTDPADPADRVELGKRERHNQRQPSNGSDWAECSLLQEKTTVGPLLRKPTPTLEWPRPEVQDGRLEAKRSREARRDRRDGGTERFRTT